MLFKLEYFVNAEKPHWVQVDTFDPMDYKRAMHDAKAYKLKWPTRIVRLIINL